MILEQLLEQFCQEFSIPLDKEGKEGLFSITIGDEIHILCRQEKEKTFLQSSIEPCPEKGREELFIYLMKANLLGQGTGGSKIGLSEDDKFLTLTRVIPYELNYKELKEEIEDFSNYFLFWREEIQRLIEEKNKSLY